MTNEDREIPRLQVLVFGTYLIVLNLTLLCILLMIWPFSVPLKDEHAADIITFLGTTLGMERRYLLIAAVAGALGSYIHLATSFADYVGNRRLFSSWLWWYALRPFIGMALAVLMYFVIRGGLIMPTGTAGDLSPYGVAAVAGLAGMFSKQATDKLREVFENLFKTEEATKRADKLKGDKGRNAKKKPGDT